MKMLRVGQDAFMTCGSKLWHVSRKLIAGGLIALTSGVLLNMVSTEHGYFAPMMDVAEDLWHREIKNTEESEENVD